MSKKVSFLFSFVAFFFLFLGLSEKVNAQAINYHTYKYGTHQTSMADGYYAKPAEIVADGNQYLVTMTIRTKKNLSPYPVKVLTIDGQAPLNVVKTRHGSDYDYRYSFHTNNLRRTISSKISIDVPQVYKATHDISFSFDTANLPKLKSAKSITKNKTTADNVKETKASNTGKASQSLIDQAKQQSETVKAKEDNLAKKQMAQNMRNQRENQRNQKLYYYTLLGGILSTTVLIVAAIFFVLSAKSKKRDR